MDNPLLLPICGALAIALLLLVVLVLRRRRNQVSAEGEPETLESVQDSDSEPQSGSEPESESLPADLGEEDPWASLDALTDPDWVDLDAADEEPWAPCGVDSADDPLDVEPDEEPWVPCEAEPVDAQHIDLEPVDEVPADEVPAAEAGTAAEPLEADAVFDAPQSRESVNIRSLKAQVRTLEEALGRLQTEPGATASGDQEAEEASFRRQVAATIRGLGQRTLEDELPERTLARVAAAIDRLDAPDDLTRPVLPAVAFDLAGHRMALAQSRDDERLALPAALIQLGAVTTQAPAPTATLEHSPDEQSPVEHAPLEQAYAAPAFEPSPAALVDHNPGYQAPPEQAGPEQGFPEQGFAEQSFAEQAFPEPGIEPATDTTTFEPSQAAPVEQDLEPEQVMPAPRDPDLVLPVPPPAPVQPPRQRRWGRRGA